MSFRTVRPNPKSFFLLSILLLLVFTSCKKNVLFIEGREVSTQNLVTPKFGIDPNTLFAESKKIMISTDSIDSSKVGLEIYKKGGNTIDVAVASSFAVSVTRPSSTGIGGGGFLVYHHAKSGKSYAFDFRERAPSLANRNMYKGRPKEESLLGYKSVGVPGMVAGLIQIHKKFGKLPLKEVLAPAIRLAEHGFIVYPDLSEAIQESEQDMSPGMKKIFIPGGKIPEPGEVLVQKDLAKTLKIISETGDKDFYTGAIAKALAEEVSANGGAIHFADLKNYKVKEEKPLEITYRNYNIRTMFPPSSGVHLFTMLKMLETKELHSMFDFSQSDYYHFLAEVMRRGYSDRAVLGGDPGYTKIPVETLVSSEYAKEKISDFNPTKSTPSSTYLDRLNLKAESHETTHISVVDAEGNAVSTTHSINYRFGAAVVLEGYGFVLNDTMDDFSRSPGEPNVYGLIGAEANSIQPGKTPLSSMSPTIVLKNGETFLVTGAPGGSYIVNAVLQSILFTLDLNLTLYESVARGRIHHQFFPDALSIEGPATDTATFNQLKAKKHEVRLGNNMAKLFCVKRENGTLYGAADPRGDGIPVGE
ncbi:gamma-glutamyltransferase [Leptospira andrefontaineae]|uniref:Glutathione hydrolase proenzyme n=1 Tax=Leptospira andrefontaineae TaxID=2484976 RepID=A0A4R9H2N9_9LEPT|nr:gamma-glutamyltransferase [Leptospira andrefontaineae]TGK38936.1 gamma-glutamyltransferase [Leptospira andrefontaineae]